MPTCPTCHQDINPSREEITFSPSRGIYKPHHRVCPDPASTAEHRRDRKYETRDIPRQPAPDRDGSRQQRWTALRHMTGFVRLITRALNRRKARHPAEGR